MPTPLTKSEPDRGPAETRAAPDSRGSDVEVRARLRRADAAREAGEAGAGEAESCYLDLQEHLDPTRSEDVPRIHWALSRLRGPDPRFRDLAGRATGATEGSPLWVLAHGLSGLFLAREDPVAASELFRRALRVAWGTRDRLELAICVNLGQCSLRLGREFEAFVGFRRALEIAPETLGEPGRCHSLKGLAVSLVDLGEWEASEQAVRDLDRHIPYLPEALRPVFRDGAAAARADAALSRGRYEEALEYAGQVREIGGPRDPQWHPLFCSHALILLGRLPDAAECLRSAAALGADAPVWELRRTFLESLHAICVGDAEAAGRLSHALLDRLEAPEGRACAGSGRRLEMAVILARALEGLDGSLKCSRRAVDVAAGAVLERIRELDRFVRDLPGFADLDSYCREVLTRYRRKLISERGDVLEAAGRLFTAARDAGDPDLLPLAGDGELLLICAWCHRVRRPDGAWVPIGQFFAVRKTLSVTHGLCPSCRRRIG